MNDRKVELILDTHIWLWLAFDDQRLRVDTRRAIEDAARRGILGVSAISIWEIAMLVARGRVELDMPVRTWIGQSLARAALGLADVTPDIMIEAYELPAKFHEDPADRMIVATARLMRATLLTRDRLILDYGTRGHVKILSA